MKTRMSFSLSILKCYVYKTVSILFVGVKGMMAHGESILRPQAVTGGRDE